MLVWHAATLVVGLAALVYGSDRAVEAAATIANRAGISVFFVGVTLVAVGSSLPEIATAAYGSIYGHGDFVVGHIVGSATSQITLGVGIVALLSPLAVERHKIRVYGGGMLVAMVLLLAALWSGGVSHLEGLVLALAYLLFLAGRYEEEDFDGVATPRENVSHPYLRGILGLGFVLAGGHLLVTGSTGLAAALGAPQYLLGILTGLGTTSPEIAIAALAVHRDEGDIAVGTLLGSNITDPLFSLGFGAALAGVRVTNRTATMRSVLYMLVVSAVIVAVLYRYRGMGRRGGVVCVALYLPTFLFT